MNRLYGNPIIDDFREQSHLAFRQHWAKDELHVREI